VFKDFEQQHDICIDAGIITTKYCVLIIILLLALKVIKCTYKMDWSFISHWCISTTRSIGECKPPPKAAFNSFNL